MSGTWPTAWSSKSISFSRFVPCRGTFLVCYLIEALPWEADELDIFGELRWCFSRLGGFLTFSYVA